MEPRTEAEWSSPSPRLGTMRRVEVAAATLLLAAAAGVLAGLAGPPWAGAVAAGAGLVAGLVADVFVQRRVRAWGWGEREGDPLVRRGVLVRRLSGVPYGRVPFVGVTPGPHARPGVLVRRLSVVPYGRMQFVDVTAGPIERSFELATVRMHTAAAASDARIPGLARDVAARLRDQLATLGEARAAGL